MRILHTSDWHLGQSFYNKSRATEHEALVDWVLTQVQTHHIDLVILAGDIFDTATPPSYARKLYNDALLRLSDSGCEIIVIAGNHDSVAVLDEGQEILKRLKVHVISNAAVAVDELVIPVKDQDGSERAIVCALPFIRARDVTESVAGLSEPQRRQQLCQAIADRYTACFEYAEQIRQDRPIPIIATGHLTTVGVTRSESEREIYVGTLEAFPSDLLPPADYIALGHIHRAQTVGGQAHVRYSGSPIPLSFDELARAKSAVMVEFDGSRATRIELLDIPLFQPMQTLRGDLGQIEKKLATMSFTDSAKPVWLDIEVVTDDHIAELPAKIRELVADYPVEVLLLRRQKPGQVSLLPEMSDTTLSELTPEEVFEKRLEAAPEIVADPARHAMLLRRFRDVVESIQNETDTEEKP